ncbi:ABC transporter ATP-binding protein [Eubacterium sp. 1001713B170207_170306_E7]|uniref:ABC transporter ATP-binding protein n=1 Tax=Eubacterium sp. 1001713B170207_170306_E7 TaxID=2787097 RepID=UPI001898CBDE|nr:ABC transporter ATP-binding protein [Eubacterium sp. 1001713B170207_170306_E7]
MHKLQTLFQLSDKGYENLKKAILACTLTNLSLMLPFCVTIQIFVELLKPLMGGTLDWNRMWLLFGLGIVSFVLVFLANKNDYKKTYITSYMEAENTRVSVAERIRLLPMSFFNAKDLSELTTNLIGDCSTLEHVLSHVVPQLISNAISCTVICVCLAFFDWRLALTVYCTIPIAFAIIFLSRKWQDKMNKRQIDSKLKASEQVQEYIEGIKVIKSCNMAGEKSKELNTALLFMKKMAIKMELFTGTLVTGAQLILQAGIGLTIFAGAQLLTGGKIELIPLLMFYLIVVRIYGPILTELTLLPELFHSLQSVRRMKALREVDYQEGREDIELPDCEIVFDHVRFGYNTEEVLKDVSFTISEKAITALVGPSGSGKSTVAKLAARFWDISGGSIILGGVDISTLDPEYLMDYMSYVFQDVVLFNDTVYNNIKIGNMDATEEEVLAAAKAACCDVFIEKMPDGYNTMLGENGSTISGGERQRISIARALLKNAPIILLDEATASLDPENEMLIQQAISHLIADKTVLVIAHRLRTVAGADKIIVLDEGKVVEEGTHETLMDHKGLYQRLYSLQQESMEWSV